MSRKISPSESALANINIDQVTDQVQTLPIPKKKPVENSIKKRVTFDLNAEDLSICSDVIALLASQGIYSPPWGKIMRVFIRASRDENRNLSLSGSQVRDLYQAISDEDGRRS